MFLKSKVSKWKGPIHIWEWPNRTEKYIKLDSNQLALKTKHAPMLIQNIKLCIII
jgi:hypothetical protein